jgi:large subunit ribosomal protein L5
MVKAPPASVKYEARIKRLYIDKYVSELKKELELENVFQVPRLEKIVINAGLGRAKDDKRLLEVAANTIRKITGQQPIETVHRQF